MSESDHSTVQWVGNEAREVPSSRDSLQLPHAGGSLVSINLHDARRRAPGAQRDLRRANGERADHVPVPEPACNGSERASASD